MITVLIKEYESIDELMYCICHNIDINSEDLICPVCKINRKKFTDKCYRSTCCKCSPNANPNKITKFKNTINLRTAEESKAIGMKIKQSQIIKYGCLGYNQLDKVKNTKLNKYGDMNYNNRKKFVETCLSKYGVKSNLLLIPKNYTKEQIDKSNMIRRKTLNDNYGVDYCWQIPAAQEKALAKKRNTITKFESDNNCINQTTVIKEYGQGWLQIKNELDYLYSGKNKYLTKESIQKIIDFNNNKANNTKLHRSSLEEDICNFLRSYNIEFTTNCNDVILNDNDRFYELDIYSEKNKIAIEANGTYWHSSTFKDKYYHERKSIKSEKNGIRLIHIYEYEWNNPKLNLILKSLLLVAFNKVPVKIFARKCIIKEISDLEAKMFNDNNNLYGHEKAEITYGLFYGNKLVQIMSFKRNNRKIKDNWKIVRSCTCINTVVVGGFSKLFKYFIENISPKQIFDSCDFNKFNGNSYSLINMNFVKYSGPVKKTIINGNITKNSNNKPSANIIWDSGYKNYNFNNILNV